MTTAQAVGGAPPQLDLTPLPPAVHHEPLRVADDVFMIRQLMGEGSGAPMNVYCNSLVIAGSEPVLVDTGAINDRQRWLDDVFGIVKPADVRWIYISHDDPDHLGNLSEVLRRCPNATLVVDWLLTERIKVEYHLPPQRMLWVDDGDHFQAGDRALVAMRPPTYDSPATRGLFDTRTRMFWGSDAFGAAVPHHVDRADELPLDDYLRGLVFFNKTLSPWTSLADPRRFADSVHAVRTLDPVAITSCHAPLAGPAEIPAVLGAMERLPRTPAPPLPGQPQLEQMIAAMTHGPAG